MTFLADWWFAITFVIFALMIAAIADPNGAINTFMILIIDLVKNVFPNTPDDMKIASWVASFQDTFPIIGGAILVETLNGVLGMIAMMAIIKIWKLLPFV